MFYHNITKDDLKNGDGVRVVLWVSGCEHHCPECQNPQTWDKESGVEFGEAELVEIGTELEKDYVSGITFSGGDPLAPYNTPKVLELCKWVRKYFPNKTIWLYTGYNFESLIFYGNFNHIQIFKLCDVIVDGEYKKDLRDPKLKWRGSSNQRVIDVKKSLAENKVVLWCD